MFDLFRSRDKAVRILLGAILVVVALSMVTYLIPGAGGGGATFGGSNDLLAKVGDETITMSRAQLVMNAAMRSRQIPPQLVAMYMPRMLDQMIVDRSLAYEAKRLGLEVSDEDVANAVANILPPELIKNGKLLNKDQYAAVLADQNMTIPEFEADMRRQLMVNRLRDLVGQSILVTPAEVEKLYQERHAKVKLEYVMIAPARVTAQAKASDADVRAYYDKNTKLFQSPERRSAAILVLDPAKIEATIQPTDADLHGLYNSSLERFRMPERVHVRHILLKTAPGGSDDAKEKARMEDLLKQIKAGGNFADLATKNSDDKGSAVKGGDLDWITRGQTVKPFEEAAFTLKPGETSGIIKTVYGYHILQVIEKQDAGLRTFDQVKGALAMDYRKKKVSESLQMLGDKMAADLKKDPLHPEAVAAATGAQLIRRENALATDPIAELGANPELSQAIAAAKKGDVTQEAVLSGNRLAVAVVTGITPAHPASFEEVQSQIKARLEKANTEKLLDQQAAELLAKAKSSDLGAAAKAMGLELKSPPEVDRSGSVEGVGSAALFSQAFSQQPGSLVGPITAQEGRVIAKVISLIPADAAGLEAQRSGLRDEIKNQKSRESVSVFEQALKERLKSQGKLKIYQNNLDRLVASYKS